YPSNSRWTDCERRTRQGTAIDVRTAMNLASEIREGIKISLAAIWANKLRSALTTLGIIIGILTVSLMAMAIQGLNGAFMRSISVLGADVFYIEKFPWESRDAFWKFRGRRDLEIA